MATTAKTPPVTTPGNLAPLELQALAVAGKDAKKWRDQLPEGKSQPVDFLVRVRGEIDVAADDPTATASEKPGAERLLALVFASLGPAKRRQLATDLVKSYAGPDPSPEAVGLAKSVVENLTVQEQKLKRGNVTGRVTLSRRAS